MRTIRPFSVACLALSLAGCGSLPTPWDDSSKASFRPGNYVDAGPIPAEVRRVGVLPFYTDAWRPADLEPLETAFAAELGKFVRFELVALARGDLDARFGHGSYISSAALPADFLDRLRSDFGLDAVLFVDVTHYAPYQPLALGVRAKLVAVADGRAFWSFDSMFDSAQPEVATAARRYHREQSRPSSPLDDTASVLQSPARYAKYVANAVFETLPKRETK